MSTSTQEAQGLRRKLQSRHLSMIAIGGSIGTGLFVASGATIANAGPGGALLAYLLIGLMVYFLMTSLGEMAAYMPVSGSFAAYGSHFVDPAFGFAQGWNYWYNWAITVAVELAASAIIMKYWFPEVPGYVWSAGFLAIIVALNGFTVKGFGEAEFWCSLIKVVTVIAFIGIGLLMVFGIMHGESHPGWSNLSTGDAPFVGGFPALLSVAMIAGFSFQGTELIGVAAGESDNPGKNIPRAVRQVFWRILLFYVFAIFIIGVLLPYNDPQLLKNDVTDISASPFTLVFDRAGLALAAAVMNTVILTAILSAGNSGMYASTRMLYTMACSGMAPKWLAGLSRNGVPVNALMATTLVAMLCFLTSLFGDQTVYMWLMSASGMSGFIAWLGIAVCHYRFRKGYLLQGGELHQLPYKALFFPFGPLLAFALCLLVTLGQDYSAFTEETIDWKGAAATYVGIPLFFALWLGYKLKNKTRYVRYHEMQFPQQD
ncbi:MAG: amino acid permease [Tolumonas sp.]|jgi:lysine-specific permease|nr:amino acid permease [Tolumonas sp.]